MQDINCRIEGRAGRITLNRPKALNALTWEMCLEIDKALVLWANDPSVSLLIIDGLPCDKAFCAGGDLAQMYETGRAGDYDYGRRFWQDEYRMNARLFNFPKPVVTFLHGFVMGGGVGVGCHGSHRVVCEDSRIAMPECKVGLVPDVGGSLLLARAPGRLGEYLGITSTRMKPGDALHAGFADYPHQIWRKRGPRSTRCSAAKPCATWSTCWSRRRATWPKKPSPRSTRTPRYQWPARWNSSIA